MSSIDPKRFVRSKSVSDTSSKSIFKRATSCQPLHLSQMVKYLFFLRMSWVNVFPCIFRITWMMNPKSFRLTVDLAGNSMLRYCWRKAPRSRQYISWVTQLNLRVEAASARQLEGDKKDIYRHWKSPTRKAREIENRCALRHSRRAVSLSRKVSD